ncbi:MULTISPECIES: hypothetical protein [unclassified Streptomyces]|uniref:hypothetical protein n=1 Tax=unclassified Streptomyces TaxID=2593676 RepID=UPI002366B282|nr:MULTISPECIES: hypothetical protein [unclassified Streptomyces]MDF3144967.1 hypothetical protein [Streptomyces sp. T21Q-yed]WDF39443.1 hypothetical protein PBV52_22885 [Streptomyces sp. T12]
MNHDALELTEAHYELVISVDARRSGAYDDVDKPRMRARIYRVLETAFTHAKVARDAVHMEDRGDGVLLSVPGRIAVSRLLGLWLIEVHEKLRDENRDLAVPLGLRIGMHVGPVRYDERGISGRAVDLACRLADSPVARQLLDAEKADLVLVTSQSLYEDVVSGGGKFIEPAHYSSARLELKEGAATAWFHLPGRPAPEIPEAEPVSPSPSNAPSPASAAGAPSADDELDDDEEEDEDEDEFEAVDMNGHRPGHVGIHQNVRRDAFHNEHNVYHGPVQMGGSTNRVTEQGKD